MSSIPARPRRRRLDATSALLLRALEHARSYTTLPLAWTYRATDQKATIDADVKRWVEIFRAHDEDLCLHSLLYAFEEFRGIFYYRLSRGNATGALLGRLLRHIWKPVASLCISTSEIGPGLFVAHGHATTLAAERIGANCYVHQGVTVGWDYRSERAPIIEDDVFIGAGAVIVGAVTIGRGARVGSNAVVLCDVPAGATAVGVPARIFPAPGEIVVLERLEMGAASP